MSGLGPWRLAGRLARRDVQRHLGRTILVTLLVALPVAGMTVGAAGIRGDAERRTSQAATWSERFDDQYGAGTDVALLVPRPPDGELPSIPIPDTWTVRTWEYAVAPVYVDGVTDPSGGWVQFTETTDVDAMMIDLDGRRPERADEVMIDAAVAEQFDLGLGDEFAADYIGPLTVTGISRGPDGDVSMRVVGVDLPMDRLRDRYLAVAMGTNGHEDDDLTRVLGDVATALGITATETGGSGLVVRPGLAPFEFVDGGVYGGEPDTVIDRPETATPLAINWILGTIGLALVGIIIAAAFSASANRQVVTAGQLLANGASPGVVRRSLALQGTWSGTVGSLTGLWLGAVAVWFLDQRTWLDNTSAVSRWAVRPLDLLVIGFTGVLAATAAALVPARLLARVPVLAALAGRRPVPPVPRRMVPIGVGAGAFGTLLLVVAVLAGSSSGGWLPVFTAVAGGVLVLVGMIGLSPVVLSWVTDAAAGLGRSWRLGARSLSRNRFRSTAVVAVIGAAITTAVAGSAFAVAADDPPAVAGNVATLIADQHVEAGSAESIIDPEVVPTDGWVEETTASVRAALPEATVIPVRFAVVDPAPQPAMDYWSGAGRLLIADDAVRDHLGLTAADDRALEETGGLAWSDDYVEPGAPSSVELVGESDTVTVAVGHLGPGPDRYVGSWDAIVTPETAAATGLEIVTGSLMVVNDDDFSGDEREALRALGTFSSPGAFYVDAPVVSAGTFMTYVELPSPNWFTPLRVQILVGLIAFVLAGLVVAIGLGLGWADARGERAVLDALGVSPAVRRRTAAAQAAILSGVGGVLAVPTAMLPLWALEWALHRQRVDGMLLTTDDVVAFPWATVAALVVVLPLVAGAVTWAVIGVTGWRPGARRTRFAFDPA